MDQFFQGLSTALSVSPMKSPSVSQSPASRTGQVGVGLRLNSKLQILEVVEGGAASNNGLIRVGDFLTSVDGAVVVGEKPQDITHLLLGAPGSIAALGIRRPDGTQIVVNLNRGSKQSVGVGMKLQRNDANKISVLEVARGGMAEGLRIMPGDVIEDINGQNVLGWTTTDATPLLRSSGERPLRVTFLRAAARERFTVEFEKGAAADKGMSTSPNHRQNSPHPPKEHEATSTSRLSHPPHSSFSPAVAAADPMAKAMEAQHALEEAHRKLAEAQSMIAEVAMLKAETAAPGHREGGSRRRSREDEAAEVHASLMATMSEAQAEREAAVRRQAVQAEIKRRAAWEQEEAEVAEDLSVRLRAAEAEAKRVRAWEEEEAM